MTRILLRRAFVLLFLCSGSSLHAADRQDPAALAAAVAPYLDDAALVVIHLDTTRLDLAPAVARVKEMFTGMGTPQQRAAAIADTDKTVAAVGKWAADFNAAGARDCYAVVSMSGFPEFPIYVVVPLPAGANAEAVGKLLEVGSAPGLDAHASVRKDVVLWGRKAMTDRIAAMKAPSPRPDLAKAFEAAGDTAVQVAFVPSEDARKVLAELAPDVPDGPFAGEGQTVAKGIQWGVLGANLSPGVSFALTIQSPDAPAADRLADLIDRALGMARVMITRAAAQSPDGARLVGDIDALIKAFTPKVATDRLTLALDADQSLKLTAIILPALAKAREQSKQVQTLSNIRQILLGCIMFANDHANQFPPDLLAMTKSADLPAVVLRNPRNPEEDIGFAYVQPMRGTANGAQQVVVYEVFDKPPARIAVGFADGHAEVMDYARFQKALEQSKARNGAK